FAHALLLPFPRHLHSHCIRICEYGAERGTPVFMRFAYDRSCALAPDRLMAREPSRRIVEIFRKTASHGMCVLDRHHRALAEKRQRGMTCVAKKRDAPFAPASHRSAHHHCPFKWLFNLFDNCMHVRVPTPIVV